MNLREALLDAAEHSLMPVDLEVRMETSLHQHAGASEFDGLANLFVDGVEIQDVTFLGRRAFQRTIKSAESAILGAKVGVIDVAVNDVRHGAFGMDFASYRVRFHADPDQIVGPKHLQSLLFGQ